MAGNPFKDDPVAVFKRSLYGFKSQYVYTVPPDSLRRLVADWEPADADSEAGPKFDTTVRLADYAEGHINPHDNYTACPRKPARNADSADAKFLQSYNFALQKMLVELPVVKDEVCTRTGASRSVGFVAMRFGKRAVTMRF